MAKSVNYIINETEVTLNYDISSPEMKDCRDGDFNFSLRSYSDNRDKGLFQVTDGYLVISETKSLPFPAGAFEVKKQKRVNREVYKVTLNRNGNYKLGDYF